MVSRKVEKDKYGPGWGEVIFGALASLVLGSALAVGFLVAKPVLAVKELPKQPAPATVYYIEGGSRSDNGKQWMRKQQLFTEGSSVALNEDELNAWIASETAAPAPPPPAAGQKAGAPPSATANLLELGTPNFRLHGGQLQIGSKGTLNLSWWGVKETVIVQAAGRFEKEGGTFTFEPDEFYVGSCPIHRLPGVGGFLFHRLISRIKVPDDIAAAWRKVADVSIEDDTLKLTMP